jgi:large subunit ribosomal protein L29
MAETTTKKAAPKKAEKVEASLTEQLALKRTDLLEAKKSLAAGELVNPRVVKAHRKDIARLLTKINAQEGGK